MELYEVAKMIDVIVIFVLIYGLGLGGLMYWVLEFVHWCVKKVKQHLKKKKADTTEE